LIAPLARSARLPAATRVMAAAPALLALLLATAALPAARAQQAPVRAPAPASAAGEEFTYRVGAGDTLIGLSARLLLEPRRWPELQRRNRIADPRRMPRGSAVRIPYGWLRISRQPARVIERSGTVRVDGREVAVGALVEAGASIETAGDGALTLELADGSVMTVQPATRLRIERLQRIEGAAADEAVLQLERGKVESQVRPRGDMGRFEIRTPAAVSAVRGTGFRAGFADAGAGAGTTETLEGAVGVDAAGTGVTVPAGFGTRAEPGRPPQPPVPLLPAPSLAALPPVNDTATLRWEFPPVAGAVRYRHQVARDARFRALVAEALTEAPGAAFEGLADGPYWIRSRALDPSTIEGLDAARAIEQRRRLDAPVPASPVAGARRIGERTRFEWSPRDGATAYRFQLARDPQFAPAVEEREVAPAAAGAPVTVELERLPAGAYAWRIAAVDARGVAGHWSAPQAFVQKPPPVAAEPLAATAGAAQGRREFRWDASASATGYEWQLARRPGFERVVRSGRSAAPQLVLEDLQPGRWYLRVRPLDDDGFEAPYGPAGGFEVAWPAWVRVLVPALLLLPTL
jgi:hypothetical protein